MFRLQVHGVKKIRNILRRHILAVGLFAVIIPLIIILGLQYNSLVELEKTRPVARKEYMRKYLTVVAREVYDFYRTTAEQTLSVPPEAFNQDPLEEIDGKAVVNYFAGREFKGAKRIFVGTTGETLDRSYALVLFYDPVERRLEREPDSPEWKAAHAACATWMVHRMTNNVPESPHLTVDERDPDNRVLVKPIIDEKTKMVVGTAGMIVDEEYFKQTVLPRAIENSLQKFYPDTYQDAIVSLMDSNERVLLSSQPFEGQPYEVGGLLPFIFKDLRLGMRMREMTEEQNARRLFAFNLSLTVLMTLFLIGGIVMALKTASREMKLSQMKADFVSNVSHELRTPLASIRVFGEFLKLGRVKEPDKVREYGEYIETESRRLTQLINNILDFSKIESGRKTYQFESADVAEVISETLRTFAVQLSQKGFNIDFQEPPRPLPPAVIDANALSQAFMNLLDNAVKYSGDSKEITVSLGKKDEYITISVSDHGIGISRDEREKIFEKFYRVSTGLVHDVKGSGLGLSIVKHIVDAHRGLVTLNSKPGLGSTFTIYLPAKPAVAVAASTRGEEIEESGPSVGPEIEYSNKGF
jgi:signal transduction histidine kinase